MADISELGYTSIKKVDDMRNGIMNAVATVAGSASAGPDPSGTGINSPSANMVNFGSRAGQMAGLGASAISVDITTGAGALVLDDVLQALSTVEQASAQLVAAENRAQQQVNSLARNS